jgi:Ca2+ transporting ATPase
MIKECFEDTILRILVVAAIVSLAVGIYQDGPKLGSADGGSIILAIMIIVSVTVGNNLVKER